MTARVPPSDGSRAVRAVGLTVLVMMLAVAGMIALSGTTAAASPDCRTVSPNADTVTGTSHSQCLADATSEQGLGAESVLASGVGASPSDGVADSGPTGAGSAALADVSSSVYLASNTAPTVSTNTGATTDEDVDHVIT